MEQQSDNLRERLLANLPQPGNLAQYREETATLLAKHERALRTESWTKDLIVFCAFALLFFYNWMLNRGLDANANRVLLGITAMFFLAALIAVVRFYIYDGRVATLKELKQVQLQILELQASLQREAQPPSAQ